MSKKITIFCLTLVASLSLAISVEAVNNHISPAVGEVNSNYSGKERVMVLENGKMAVYSSTNKLLPGFPVSVSGFNFISTPALSDLNGDNVKEIVVVGRDTANVYKLFVYGGDGTLLSSIDFTDEVVNLAPVVFPSTAGTPEKVLISTDGGKLYEYYLVGSDLNRNLIVAAPEAVSLLATTNKNGTEIYTANSNSSWFSTLIKTNGAWGLKNSLNLSKPTLYTAFDQEKNIWYGVDNNYHLSAVDVKTATMVSGWPVLVGYVIENPVIAEVVAGNSGKEIVCVTDDGQKVILSQAGQILSPKIKPNGFANRGGLISDIGGVFSWSSSNFGKIISDTKNLISSYYSRISLPEIQFANAPVLSELVFGTPVYTEQAVLPVTVKAVGDKVNITSAEYYFVDKNNNESTHFPLEASDGTFDAFTEIVAGNVDISSWNFDSATYTVKIVASDSFGNTSLPISKDFNIIDQTDSDDTSAGFGGGQKTDVVWNSDSLKLTAGGLTNGIGNYVSRVFDAGADTVWNRLAWNPLVPFGRQLPDNAQKETIYSTGNVDMSGNVLLYHFENEAIDSSGSNNNGVWQNGASSIDNGLYGKAGNFANGSYANAGVNTSLAIAKNITLEAWVNPADSAAYKTIMARDGSYYLALSNLKPTAYFMGTSPASWVGSTTALPLNTWSHIVTTYDGVNIKIYINGVLSRTALASGNTKTDSGKELWIGNRKENLVNYRYKGLMDDVAVYNRVLSVSEILSHYTRSLAQTKFQVRSCQAVDCTGVLFIGPDGTANTYYTAIDSVGSGLPVVNLSGLPSTRYFQYSLRLSSKLSSANPALNSITIGPAHIFSDVIITPPTITPVDQTDDDNSTSGFGGGMTNNVVWNSELNTMELSAIGKNLGSGTFESRIIDAGISVLWQGMNWKTISPVGKELPDNQTKEVDYAQNNVDMVGNELLAHLNETIGASVFIDSSGKNSIGSANGTAIPTMSIGGIKNNTAQFDGVDDNVNFGSANNLAIQNNITMEAWVNPSGGGTYKTILTRDGSYYLALNNLRPVVYLAGLNKPGWHTANSAIELNKWSLITVTYDGANIKIYINGKLDKVATGITGLINTTSGKNLLIGNRPEPKFAFAGKIDEVSIFSRVLNTDEVFANYQRLKTNMEMQVRVCDSATCDGVQYANFSSDLTGRYIQYKTIFATNDSTLSPQLSSVSFTPNHNLP